MIEKNYTVDCLDHGFVKLLDYMGSDATVEETQHFSFAISNIMSELFPISWRALIK